MRAAVPVLMALALGACAQPKDAPQATTPAAPAAPQAPVAAAPTQDVPRIYMAIQPDAGGSTSVIFAIDTARDGTPMNDPAIRITPEEGQCNPQELRRYNFPSDRAGRPIFGPQEAAAGISARDLPNFMAMAVTSEMMRLGLVVHPDESQPQNVCARKLWEQLIVAQSG